MPANLQLPAQLPAWVADGSLGRTIWRRHAWADSVGRGFLGEGGTASAFAAIHDRHISFADRALGSAAAQAGHGERLPVVVGRKTSARPTHLPLAARAAGTTTAAPEFMPAIEAMPHGMPGLAGDPAPDVMPIDAMHVPAPMAAPVLAARVAAPPQPTVTATATAQSPVPVPLPRSIGPAPPAVAARAVAGAVVAVSDAPHGRAAAQAADAGTLTMSPLAADDPPGFEGESGDAPPGQGSTSPTPVLVASVAAPNRGLLPLPLRATGATSPTPPAAAVVAKATADAGDAAHAVLVDPHAAGPDATVMPAPLPSLASAAAAKRPEAIPAGAVDAGAATDADAVLPIAVAASWSAASSDAAQRRPQPGVPHASDGTAAPRPRPQRAALFQPGLLHPNSTPATPLAAALDPAVSSLPMPHVQRQPAAGAVADPNTDPINNTAPIVIAQSGRREGIAPDATEAPGPAEPLVLRAMAVEEGALRVVAAPVAPTPTLAPTALQRSPASPATREVGLQPLPVATVASVAPRAGTERGAIDRSPSPVPPTPHAETAALQPMAGADPALPIVAAPLAVPIDQRSAESTAAGETGRPPLVLGPASPRAGIEPGAPAPAGSAVMRLPTPVIARAVSRDTAPALPIAGTAAAVAVQRRPGHDIVPLAPEADPVGIEAAVPSASPVVTPPTLSTLAPAIARDATRPALPLANPSPAMQRWSGKDAASLPGAAVRAGLEPAAIPTAAATVVARAVAGDPVLAFPLVSAPMIARQALPVPTLTALQRQLHERDPQERDPQARDPAPTSTPVQSMLSASPAAPGLDHGVIPMAADSLPAADRAAAPAAPAASPGIDTDELVERALQALMLRLEIESERRGFTRWA